MSKPIAQIVSRRHPLAFAMYAMVLVLGLIFIFQWFGSGQTQDTVFPHVPGWIIAMWKWEMTLGAGLSLVGLLCPARQAPSWPDLADLLHAEAIGAFVSAMGLATFALAGLKVAGWHNDAQGLTLYMILVAGHLWRCVQSFKEARQLAALADALTVEEERHE